MVSNLWFLEMAQEFAKEQNSEIAYVDENNILLLTNGSIWRLDDVIDDWIYDEETGEEYPNYRLEFTRI